MQVPVRLVCNACGDDSTELGADSSMPNNCVQCTTPGNSISCTKAIKYIKASFEHENGNIMDPVFVPNTLVDKVMGYVYLRIRYRY